MVNGSIHAVVQILILQLAELRSQTNTDILKTQDPRRHLELHDMVVIGLQGSTGRLILGAEQRQHRGLGRLIDRIEGLIDPFGKRVAVILDFGLCPPGSCDIGNQRVVDQGCKVTAFEQCCERLQFVAMSFLLRIRGTQCGHRVLQLPFVGNLGDFQFVPHVGTALALAGVRLIDDLKQFTGYRSPRFALA